jgi:outer membrane lipoprotein-sorting protein
MTTVSSLKMLGGFALMLATVMPSTVAIAETAEEKGFAIAARSDRSDRGFVDSEVSSVMILRNAQGKESRRELFQRTLEVQDEDRGDKSIIVFESPADVSGTALLSHAKILDADDQWLYFPANKKTKRISSKNKSGPFVGSEFAFEDFTAQELNKYSYKFLREEPCPGLDGLTCDVLERLPRYEFSGYTKQIGWVDQKDFQVRTIDYYDRKDELLKTATFGDYKQYNGKYWRAHALKMVNHVTGKSTDFNFGEYKFGLGLKDRDFEKGELEYAQ